MRLDKLLVGALAAVASAGGVAAKQRTSGELVKGCDQLTNELQSFSAHVKTLQQPGQLKEDTLQKAQNALDGLNSSLESYQQDFVDSVPGLLAESITNPQGLPNLKRVQQCISANTQKMQKIVKEELPAIQKAVISDLEALSRKPAAGIPQRNATKSRGRAFRAEL